MLDTPREDRRKHGRFAGRSGVAVGGQWTRGQSCTTTS
jgi:hypothetical protein